MTPIEIDQKVFRPLLQRALVLPLTALVLLCGVLLWQMHRMVETDSWVDRTDEAIASAQQEERLLLDRETGLRGYLATGEEGFLGTPSGETLHERSAQNLARIEQLVGDNPQQWERLRGLRREAAEIEQAQDAAEAARRANGRYDADEYLNRSKRQLDHVRDGIREFIGAERELRVQRQYASQSSRDWAVGSAIGLTFLIGVGLAITSRRHLVELSRSYSEALRTAHQRSQDLKMLSDRFHATLGSIGDGVLATDDRGYVVFMNRVAEQLTGWAMQDALGRPSHEVFRIVNEGTRKPIASPAATALRTGQVCILRDQMLLLARDGREIAVEDSGAPIREESGRITGAVLVFRDMTEERRTQQALLRSEKLAATGQMASSMAHEINNPLEAVTNVVFLLQQQMSGDPQLGSLLELADAQLRRVVHIVQRTLGLYREGAHEREVQIAPLCREIANLYAATIDSKKLTLTCECDESLGIYGYASELLHTIGNMVVNAIEATPERGRVRVRARRGTRMGERGVFLTIADDGCGIGAPDLSGIFEAFYSTKEKSGSGMGLWVVRSVVDRMGGEVKTRTRTGPGSYTVFRVFLPQRPALVRAASA